MRAKKEFIFMKNDISVNKELFMLNIIQYLTLLSEKIAHKDTRFSSWGEFSYCFLCNSITEATKYSKIINVWLFIEMVFQLGSFL